MAEAHDGTEYDPDCELCQQLAEISVPDPITAPRYIVVRRRGEETEYDSGVLSPFWQSDRRQAHPHRQVTADSTLANMSAKNDGWIYTVEEITP